MKKTSCKFENFTNIITLMNETLLICDLSEVHYFYTSAKEQHRLLRDMKTWADTIIYLFTFRLRRLYSTDNQKNSDGMH